MKNKETNTNKQQNVRNDIQDIENKLNEQDKLLSSSLDSIERERERERVVIIIQEYLKQKIKLEMN